MEKGQLDFRKKIPVNELPPVKSGMELFFDGEKLTLQKEKLSVTGDFSGLLPRIRQQNLSGEALVRAARFRKFRGELTAVDATAGLGEDSFLLAASGYRVKLVERDPVIAALLWDALHRALSEEILAPVAARMELYYGDSTEMLSELSERPLLVYLDPMFPERQKSSLIKKKFQLLHELEEPCREEERLFLAAQQADPARIVVKRPGKAPFLSGKKPDYTIGGSTIRYDCYVMPEKAPADETAGRKENEASDE